MWLYLYNSKYVYKTSCFSLKYVFEFKEKISFQNHHVMPLHLALEM